MVCPLSIKVVSPEARQMPETKKNEEKNRSQLEWFVTENGKVKSKLSKKKKRKMLRRAKF